VVPLLRCLVYLQYFERGKRLRLTWSLAREWPAADLPDHTAPLSWAKLDRRKVDAVRAPRSRHGDRTMRRAIRAHAALRHGHVPCRERSTQLRCIEHLSLREHLELIACERNRRRVVGAFRQDRDVSSRECGARYEESRTHGARGFFRSLDRFHRRIQRSVSTPAPPHLKSILHAAAAEAPCHRTRNVKRRTDADNCTFVLGLMASSKRPMCTRGWNRPGRQALVSPSL
jgi:hypothetical protein